MPPLLIRLLAVLFCLAVGGLGGFATSQGIIDWYPGLNKPFFTPPNWLFGPAWTLLYSFMGWVLGELLLRPASPQRKQLLGLFGLQLGLNFLWSFLFFAWRMPGLALLEILILLGFLYAILFRLWPYYRLGFYLWLPYCLWVSFATALNAAIYWLN